MQTSETSDLTLGLRGGGRGAEPMDLLKVSAVALVVALAIGVYLAFRLWGRKRDLAPNSSRSSFRPPPPSVPPSR